MPETIVHADRLALLQIARAALHAHLNGVVVDVPRLAGALARPAGAFVTLLDRGVLRGCVGRVEPADPLARVVSHAAVAAGTADPRFPPVQLFELDALSFEVSVLGALEPIAGAQSIDIGRHGLVIEMGSRRGLLLPQVAADHGWDVHTFIEQTCRKACLPPDALQQGAALWRFEAEVFGEG